jgi:hypothetical protein
MKTYLFILVGLVTFLLLGLAFLAQAPSPQEIPNPQVERQSEPCGPRPPENSIHGKRGVYLTAYAAANSAILSEVLAQSARFGLNAIVIDVKNNEGEVCYSSQVPKARALGAVRPLLDLAKLVQELHRRGFYVIAREVVFYDPILAKSLGVPTAPWVLPTEAEAASYNLAIAQEVEGLGVDEIQFDYIRFPDDGPIGPSYSARCAAVEAFLSRAKSVLSVPISADVYGRVMWPWNAQKIDPIGQNLEGIARIVDVVSPMLYPSHFVEPELKADPYGTVLRTMAHGKARVRAPLRPYLQAFSMAIPSGMSLPEYILAQIKAAEESGADGYLFWNPKADYSGLWQALNLAQKERGP